MCAVAIPLIAAGVGAAATIYSASKASSDAAAAREQTAQQMEQARKTAAQAPQASETSVDVTAARAAAQKRAAAAYGMDKTITGVGNYYSGGGLGDGQKKQKLGM